MQSLLHFLSLVWQWFGAHAAQLAASLAVLAGIVESLPAPTRAQLARDWPRLAHLCSAIGALSPQLVSAGRSLVAVWTGAPHALAAAPYRTPAAIAEHDTDPSAPRGSSGMVLSKLLPFVFTACIALLGAAWAAGLVGCGALSSVGIGVTGGQTAGGGWQAGVDITISLAKNLVLPAARSLVDSQPDAATRTPEQQAQLSRDFEAASRALDEARTLTHSISGTQGLPEQCRVGYALSQAFDNLEGVLRIITAATPQLDPAFAAGLGALASAVDQVPAHCLATASDAGSEDGGGQLLRAARPRAPAQERLRLLLSARGRT